MIKTDSHIMRLKNLGIDTYKEAVIYLRSDSDICRSEGYEAQARIQINYQGHSIIATLNTVETNLLRHNEASLSKYAWELLNVQENDEIYLSHPRPLTSLMYIHDKVEGQTLKEKELFTIIEDVVAGRLSDVHIATFLTACANGRLSDQEVLNLTQAMVRSGDQLEWSTDMVVDKHCVGGLPGNRTSIIIVPIVTAYGMMMPKTSSRAITSPAGTADTMETLAPVDLEIKAIRNVVEKENGCIVWGGAVALSPADDILIRIERAIELDSEGQLVASILSKKISAGSTHIVIDIPIGPTAKIISTPKADMLKAYLQMVGNAMGVEVRVVYTDGMQPVGRGIGPALEAWDILAVLQGDKNAPADLRDRALTLAGQVLEFHPDIKAGTGKKIATDILDSGRAWNKFQAICQAQGGMREPTRAAYKHVVKSAKAGKVVGIDNRYLARIAKLAGAPKSKAAGIELLTPLDTNVDLNQPLFVIHAESSGELKYAMNFLAQTSAIIKIT